MVEVISGGIILLEDGQKKVGLTNQDYYNSTVNLIKILSILSLLVLGGILIFRSSIEQIIDTSYIKSATVTLWICLIGCGLTYYNIISNYKKSIKMFGLDELNQTESINRARLLGSTKFEYLSIIVSVCIMAFGLWFAGLFILMGLLNA